MKFTINKLQIKQILVAGLTVFMSGLAVTICFLGGKSLFLTPPHPHVRHPRRPQQLGSGVGAVRAPGSGWRKKKKKMGIKRKKRENKWCKILDGGGGRERRGGIVLVIVTSAIEVVEEATRVGEEKKK